MVLSVCMHSPTSWAEPNAIYSTNMCTAMHVQSQVTPGNARAYPGRFISPVHRPSLQVYHCGTPGVGNSYPISSTYETYIVPLWWEIIP